MMMRQRLPVTLMMLAIRNLDSLENDEGGVRFDCHRAV